MDPIKILAEQSELLDELGQYRRLVGKLNYLIVAGPNISFPNRVLVSSLILLEVIIGIHLYIH